MISLSHSNKFIYFIFFIYILLFNYGIGNSAVDIWEKKKEENQQKEIQARYNNRKSNSFRRY